jgi:hypothetical protein
MRCIGIVTLTEYMKFCCIFILILFKPIAHMDLCKLELRIRIINHMIHAKVILSSPSSYLRVIAPLSPNISSASSQRLSNVVVLR